MTEYRRIEALEASEHRLLTEVGHRSKNVLAIADSIVRLTNADDPAGGGQRGRDCKRPPMTRHKP